MLQNLHPCVRALSIQKTERLQSACYASVDTIQFPRNVGVEPTAPKGCPGDVLTNDVLLLESNQRLQHYECCALPTELSSGLDMGIEPMHADYSSAALPSELIKVPDILLRQNPYHGTHDTQRAVRRWSGGISYSTVVPLSSGIYAY